MRAVIYARYSSQNQREASIEDQVRECRSFIDRLGWAYQHAYFDRALSGASTLRPAYQLLLHETREGRFDVVVAESLDRLSRDQEDVAALYKRLRFAGVRLVTLAEGEITDLHVGLKGTMNALFLKDLADKTRRGLRGRVEAGLSGGGNAYGYDVMHELGPDGLPVRGFRRVNPREAEVVRRISRRTRLGARRGGSPMISMQKPFPPLAAEAGARLRSAAMRRAARAFSTTSSILAGWSGTGSATSRIRRPAGGCHA